jgi:hypothetical protein
VKIEWIIIAEGIGSASNGAITAIGLNQVLIVAPSLPVTTKRAVMVHLVLDDDSLTNVELGLAIKVLSPSGQVLAAQTAPAIVGTPQWADLPITYDIFSEFPMRLSEYGTYVVNVEITRPDGSSTKGQANFYVREPKQVPPKTGDELNQ